MPKGILWAEPLQPITLPPLFDCHPHQYITLAYDVAQSKYADSIGVIFSAPAVSIAHNDLAECLRFILPAGIPFEMEHPHLTLSFPQGSAPVQSRIMLGSADFREVHFTEPVIVAFQVEFKAFEQDRFCPECKNLGLPLRPLAPTNTSGYCGLHRDLSQNRRGSRHKGRKSTP